MLSKNVNVLKEIKMSLRNLKSSIDEGIIKHLPKNFALTELEDGYLFIVIGDASITLNRDMEIVTAGVNSPKTWEIKRR